MDKEKLAIRGGKKAVTIAQPHFEWGNPTNKQIEELNAYISNKGAMSIYGDDGIYRKLEKRIEELYNIGFCVLTNSGTSALNSAYFGLEINPGDEVIVPTYTFLATVTPLLRLGAIPVFADADPLTGNISPEDIERKITKKTVAIAITHMWGVPCEMDKITSIVKKHNLKLLEDCAHAHFTQYNGKLCGTFGDVAIFSIGAKKTWTSGEGGFVITNSPEVYARASLLGHFEVRAKEAITRLKEEGHIETADKYSDYTIGYGENYRIHPYSVVMAYALLENELNTIIKNRSESLKYFVEKLSKIKGIEPPVVTEDYYTGAMYGFKAKLTPEEVGYTGDFNQLVKAIEAENIKIKLPDSQPLHTNPLFTDPKNKYYIDEKNNYHSIIEGDFSGVTEYLNGRVTLPTFSGGMPADRDIIDQYCLGIEKVLSNATELS